MKRVVSLLRELIYLFYFVVNYFSIILTQVTSAFDWLQNLNNLSVVSVNVTEEIWLS